MKLSQSMFALLKPFRVIKLHIQDRDTCWCKLHENTKLLHEKLHQIKVLPNCTAHTLHSVEQCFKLFVDRVELFEPDDLTQGLVCLFAAYWLFNVAYSAKVYNFFTFLKQQVFGLSETVARAPVVKLIKFLQ